MRLQDILRWTESALSAKDIDCTKKLYIDYKLSLIFKRAQHEQIIINIINL
jgi:hypothetical protein